MRLVHLDTDLGGDIDDLCALALVLAWPDTRLIAVTTNSEDSGRRAGYARAALTLAQREDVPVAAGADAADGYYRVWPGLPDEAAFWPDPPIHRPVPPLPGRVEQALALLESSIRRGALIIAIGALTNLALLEQRQPGILQNAHLVVMGGFLRPPRAGYPRWDYTEDWNLQVDVASALTVLRSAEPLLVPLTVTVETCLRHSHLGTLRQGGPLAALIAHQALAFERTEGLAERVLPTSPALPADLINFLHDPLACAIALGWDQGVCIETVPITSSVEGGWLRQRAEPTGKPTRMVTAVDGPALDAHWLATVCRGA
ncbi:MAG: nucleoside hydrolase [Anaerolineae bacterium]|jgi:purine nucleosidase|nr:nucleoside hydrolase [Chloroflexota bacterium]